MESNATNQLYIFLIFILTGILIAILFDVFRILRKSFKTSDLLTNIEDILFWILTGVILLYTIFKFNNGQIRLFIFIALLTGVTLYMLIFSKTFIQMNIKIINFIKKFIKKMLDFIIFPIKFIAITLKKLIFKPISFICINIRKYSTNYFKNQKSKAKNLKNILNKPKKQKIKEGF